MPSRRVGAPAGATLQALGLVGLFRGLQSVIDVLLIGQSLWFIAAAVVLLLSPTPLGLSDC